MRKYLVMLLLFQLPITPVYAQADLTQTLHGHVNFCEQPKVSTDQITPTEDPPDMKDAWDAWHMRVHQELWRRFKPARAQFDTERLLAARISYEVTCDRRIVNARLLTCDVRYFDKRFDSLVLEIVKSLAGDPVLEFPAGSRRIVVERYGDFCSDRPRLQTQSEKFEPTDYQASTASSGASSPFNPQCKHN